MAVEPITVVRIVLHALYLLLVNYCEVIKLILRYLRHTTHLDPKFARLKCIVFRFKRDIEEISRREDFLTVDNGVISKEELKNPKWTVYSLDKRGVIFIELPQPLNKYTIEKEPFVFVPMFRDAVRCAEIDLYSYVALSEELESAKQPQKIVLFTNTARCASTLFGKMLHHEGYSRVLAEHHVLTNLAIGYAEGYWSDTDVEKLLPASVHFLKNAFPKDELLILKTASTEVKLVQAFKKVVPYVKHIFMFRRKGRQSVEKMIRRDNGQEALLKLYVFCPTLSRAFGYLAASEGRLMRELRPTNLVEYSMLVYAGPYLIYTENKDSFDIPIIWHDQLIANTEKVLKDVYECIGLPLNLIAPAKAQLKQDSQKNTFLSRDALADLQCAKITPTQNEVLKRYAARMKVEPEVSGLYD